MGGGGGGAPNKFFKKPPIKTDAPHGVHPPLKNEVSPSENQIPSLKREAPWNVSLKKHNK